MKIVDKVVENLTREKWIPMNSVKNKNYFEDLGYRIGSIGHIELDNSNPTMYNMNQPYMPSWDYMT